MQWHHQLNPRTGSTGMADSVMKKDSCRLQYAVETVFAFHQYGRYIGPSQVGYTSEYPSLTPYASIAHSLCSSGCLFFVGTRSNNV